MNSAAIADTVYPAYTKKGLKIEKNNAKLNIVLISVLFLRKKYWSFQKEKKQQK